MKAACVVTLLALVALTPGVSAETSRPHRPGRP
jgi:hypothetical protein